MTDYISREAARKELLDWCIITGYGGLTKYDVHTALDNIPAADVVEVVHGRNISKDGFLCSVCTFGDFGGFHGYKPKYCPNCGAKMEG